jgi:hypothetical protein
MLIIRLIEKDVLPITLPAVGGPVFERAIGRDAVFCT